MTDIGSEPSRGADRLTLKAADNEEQPDALPIDEVSVDVGSFSLRDYAQERPWNPDEEKYRGGTWVAKAIVVTFAASVVFWFALVFTLLLSGRSAEEVGKFAAMLGTLLKDYSVFAGVFSPLLAFVLGYYFGEKNR